MRQIIIVIIYYTGKHVIDYVDYTNNIMLYTTLNVYKSLTVEYAGFSLTSMSTAFVAAAF